jgi:ribosomal-protein-alanine N-acetyltransferase
MTPGAMAALHARCFTAPPPWTEQAFADLLDSRLVFHRALKGGFVLGRVVADEAELLTVAVAPELRRRGVGRALVTAFAADASARGATIAHLEVAEGNSAAIALYRGLGFAESGRRRGYYGPAGGDAMLMSATLPLSTVQVLTKR